MLMLAAAKKDIMFYTRSACPICAKETYVSLDLSTNERIEYCSDVRCVYYIINGVYVYKQKQLKGE